ncbi:heterokaryon incompatibility protein-domain-containing protein [Paraphoma chrysanthemicola]|nr:heterokaryon incompatibility protein-domain-containing protein [Paraphoma chrysanthemicola]
MDFRRQEAKLALPVDIREGIFRNILQDPRFQAWSQRHRHWQLHISGGPGSGKTTLAALIATRLRQQSANSVALIHVHDEEASLVNAQSSLQVSPDRTLDLSRFVNRDGAFKIEAVDISSSTDLADLYVVLADILRRSDRGYLIIDGYDRIQDSVRDVLQQNICLLGAQGIMVLLLSAVSELEEFPPAQPVICDHCERGTEEKDGLHIYWTCDLCPYDLCDTCKIEGKHCHDNLHPMSEPYDVVRMRLDLVPSELELFARADLETEYGVQIEDKVLEAVCEPSDGNINLTKLRLDHIRDLQAPSDILSSTNRLPREIVAFFDAEIERINVLELTRRYETLLAIIAVAAAGWMSVSSLEELLCHAGSSERDHSGSDYPRLRQVLRSARGLLSSIIFNGNLEPGQQESERHRVGLYIRDLGYYINEDYNQDLVLAKRYLSQAERGEQTLDRSYSFEKTVDARKENICASGGTLLVDRSAKGRLSEVSGKSITNAILREPGDICALCIKSMFQSDANSGVRYYTDQDRKKKCPICVSAYEELSGRPVSALDYHWTRRTMGRTSNSNNHLVLTLRANGLPAQMKLRRLVFMLKSELGSLPHPCHLGKTTDVEHSGEQIKRWLHTCKTEHAHCNLPKLKPYVPKRLVDIDTGVVGHCRVIEREQKVEGPYVTISHSWGRDPDFLTLTTEKMHRLMTKGFSTSELGNTNFEEAIQVSRYLGVRYIWIDSLCICQAGKYKDFKDEGQYMHLVYQHSYCNIVAADSMDGNGGLFRKRPENLLLGTNTKGAWVVLDQELWAKELLKSPIYTRGWVFQERMLSPRIVHFTRSQVFWDCSAVSSCEILPEGLPFALSAIATTDRRWRGRLQRKNSDQDESSLPVEDSLESFWKTAVLNYTSCELTNQADKTFAIWSVAKLVRDNFQLTNQYGCGLWSVALHEQLAWRVTASKRGARMDALQYAFPSWSWASVNAPIQIQDRIVAKRCYTIKNHEGARLSFSAFKDEAVNRDMQPHFAASDSLAVRGHLIPGQLRRGPSDETHNFEPTLCGLHKSHKVVLDEEMPETLLRMTDFRLLPLVARETSDEGIAYFGTALVLIATHDYQTLTRSKLMKQIFHLVRSFEPCDLEGKACADRILDLRKGIDALNACLHKVATQDRELPFRYGNAYRRVGVIYFHDLAAQEWATMRTNAERRIWLD